MHTRIVTFVFRLILACAILLALPGVGDGQPGCRSPGRPRSSEAAGKATYTVECGDTASPLLRRSTAGPAADLPGLPGSPVSAADGRTALRAARRPAPDHGAPSADAAHMQPRQLRRSPSTYRSRTTGWTSRTRSSRSRPAERSSGGPVFAERHHHDHRRRPGREHRPGRVRPRGRLRRQARWTRGDALVRGRADDDDRVLDRRPHARRGVGLHLRPRATSSFQPGQQTKTISVPVMGDTSARARRGSS